MVTNPTKTLSSVARRERCLELRLHGASLRAIADELGISTQRACQIVRAELERVQASNRELASTYRDQELSRLDLYLSRLRPRVDAGDVRAITVAVRIAERRSRLLGLDAPVRTEVSGPDGQSLEVTDALLTELLARLHQGSRL